MGADEVTLGEEVEAGVVEEAVALRTHKAGSRLNLFGRIGGEDVIAIKSFVGEVTEFVVEGREAELLFCRRSLRVSW